MMIFSTLFGLDNVLKILKYQPDPSLPFYTSLTWLHEEFDSVAPWYQQRWGLVKHVPEYLYIMCVTIKVGANAMKQARNARDAIAISRSETIIYMQIDV